MFVLKTTLVGWTKNIYSKLVGMQQIRGAVTQVAYRMFNLIKQQAILMTSKRRLNSF